MKRITTIISLALTVFFPYACDLNAQEAEVAVERYDYVKALNEKGTARGQVEVVQDERMNALLEKYQASAKEMVKMKQVPGWRVQLFSSNQQGIAKTQAESVKETVEQRYRNLPVYVAWQSPFWKVRVGDCATSEEARLLRDELKANYPDWASEIYVVKDRVNVPE